MDDFLSCCEIVLRINRMEKQLEKLGIVLESNFLNNDFYGLRNDAVKLCLKSLVQLSPEEEEKVVEIGRASCREECRSRWSPYH